MNLIDFFRDLGKLPRSVGKRIITKDPTSALQLASSLATAAATKNRRPVAEATPDVMKFVHQGMGLCVGIILKEKLSKLFS